MELTAAKIKNPYTHYAVGAVYNKWAPILKDFGQVIIAGGAARDVCAYSLAPKDFDIFILGAPKDFITYNFYKQVYDIGKCDPVHDYSGSGAHADFQFRWNNYHIQLMRSNYNTPEELLDTFDWNCCNYVFDGKDYYEGENAKMFADHKHLKLNPNWDSNPKSQHNKELAALRRAFIFSYKYNCSIDTTDQHMLLEQMASNTDAKIISRLKAMKYAEAPVTYPKKLNPLKITAEMMDNLVDSLSPENSYEVIGKEFPVTVKIPKVVYTKTEPLVVEWKGTVNVE